MKCVCNIVYDIVGLYYDIVSQHEISYIDIRYPSPVRPGGTTGKNPGPDDSKDVFGNLGISQDICR